MPGTYFVRIYGIKSLSLVEGNNGESVNKRFYLICVIPKLTCFDIMNTVKAKLKCSFNFAWHMKGILIVSGGKACYEWWRMQTVYFSGT